MTVSVDYLDEYVVEEGVQRFMFPKPQTFVCTLKEPHLVETDIIYMSDKKEGAFIFCRKHHEFVDISAPKILEKGER